MAQENMFVKELQEKGLVDERGIFALGDISSTNGNSGRAFLLLCGNELYLHAMAGIGKVGERIETIHLKEMEIIKARGGALFQILRFHFRGHTYTVRNFGRASLFIEEIKKSIGA